MFRFLLALVAWVAWGGVLAEVRSSELAGDVLVRVAEADISAAEYSNVLARKLKETFYHADAPESEQEPVRRAVLESLIEGHLLAREAVARGLVVDEAILESHMRDVDRRNQARPDWEAVRELWAPVIRENYRRGLLVDALKAQVVALQKSDTGQQLEFYNRFPEKFTQPVQNDVSVILFGVAPVAGQSAWDDAMGSAKKIRQELLGGADFSELAQIYSSDPSAADGGRMGVLHVGMLGAAAEDAVAQLSVGGITEPLVLLDGVVLLRLNSRVEPMLMPFDQVQERVAGLLDAEMVDLAWQSLSFRLRGQVELNYNKELMERLGIPAS